ncbi:hypothetical protein N7493_000379 [Penicillium malachiteum]|uniref:Uncharacterized protein n=1 Tax=Penicillium malachiteum TaxID=1324776 RepID=A0AAD6HX09_9EURO|nr:hypothetical protein N7493_000379 [Penicillium malachiteum]
MGNLITLFTLPFLLLISIPLALSAGLTISLAVFTLLLRAIVVYLEVGVALVINFFTPPTSTSTSSFLTFAPSEPPTPAAGNSRRNSNSSHNLIQSRSIRSNDALSSWSFNIFQDDPSKHKKKNYARSMVEAHHLPNAPLSMSYTGLSVSGDERRDFEGVGGWRSYPDISSRASKPRSVHSGQENPLSSRSSSSARSIAGEIDVDPTDIDADERAWLSLNHRLELPSQVVTFGASSALNSPTHLDSLASSYALLPSASSNVHNAHANTHATLQPSSDRPRHHHRSHTTSALSSSGLGMGSGLSLSLSTRPDHSSSRPVSPSTTRYHFMTPQPYAPFQPRSSTRPLPTTSVSQTNIHAATGTSNGGTSAGGGYFALSRPGAGPVPSFPVVASPVSSGYTTPGSEERDSALQLTRFIAHYPTSVRHRRRSLSGPHGRRVSIGERLN